MCLSLAGVLSGARLGMTRLFCLEAAGGILGCVGADSGSGGSACHPWQDGQCSEEGGEPCSPLSERSTDSPRKITPTCLRHPVHKLILFMSCLLFMKTNKREYQATVKWCILLLFFPFCDKARIDLQEETIDSCNQTKKQWEKIQSHVSQRHVFIPVAFVSPK